MTLMRPSDWLFPAIVFHVLYNQPAWLAQFEILSAVRERMYVRAWSKV